MISRHTVHNLILFPLFVLLIAGSLIFSETEWLPNQDEAQEIELESQNYSTQLSRPKTRLRSKPSETVEQPITLFFSGDIMLGRYIATLRERKGGNFPFSHFEDLLTGVSAELNGTPFGASPIPFDMVLGNLEGPVSTSSYVNPGTAMRFNFKPEVAALLAENGFTHLSMANNHSLDQGQLHFEETKKFLEEAEITGFGHADRIDGPWTFVIEKVKDKKIGLIGLNHTVQDKINWEELYEKIQAWDQQVDFLIVSIHWGVEYAPTANEQIVGWARSMVDAGADFIWGHHPHVIQNDEVYKGTPIYYSLGNFVFDQYWSQKTQEGLTLGLKLTPLSKPQASSQAASQAAAQSDPNRGQWKIEVLEQVVDLVNQGEPKLRSTEPSL